MHAREWESPSCVDLFARNSLSCQKQRVGTCFQHVGMRLWADEGGRISDHSPTSLGVRKYIYIGSKHIEYEMYAYPDTHTGEARSQGHITMMMIDVHASQLLFVYVENRRKDPPLS